MAPENDKNNQNVTAEEQRLAKIALSLRDEGLAPERDLWSDIDAAITVAEQNQIRPVVQRRSPVWPKFAALAAAIGLVVVGWWGSHANLGEAQFEEKQIAQSEINLEAIDQALSEVNRALAESPEDASLTRMARKLYLSRGRVLRENARSATLGG